MTRLQVQIEGYRVQADVGINPDERGKKQPLDIDVIVCLEAETAESIRETLDYRIIAAAIDELGDRHIPLIETFARTIAEKCLATGLVAKVKVTVRKPKAIKRGLAGVSYECERQIA